MKNAAFSLKQLLGFLIIYIHISFVFSNTVFKMERIGVVIYLAFFFLSGIFLLYVGRTSLLSFQISRSICISFVFLLFLAIYNFFEENYTIPVAYMSLAIILLLFYNCRADISRMFPFRLMLGLEIFFLLSVFFQMLFPGVYDSFMSGFLEPVHYQNVTQWSRRGYFAGFTHQLGVTGEYISYGIPLLLYKKNKSPGTYLMLGLFYVGLIMTGKRMFFLIALVAPLLVRLCAEKMRKRRYWVLFLGSAVVFILLFLFYQFADAFMAMGGTVKRIAQILVGFNTDVTTGRVVLWEKAIALFKSSPVLGVGVGRYSELAGVDSAAHNAFLQLLAETGIVGFLLFVTMLAVNMHHTIKKIRSGNADDHYLKISLYFQSFFILYSLTGNTLVGIGDIAVYCLFFAFSLAQYDMPDCHLKEVDLQ